MFWRDEGVMYVGEIFFAESFGGLDMFISFVKNIIVMSGVVVEDMMSMGTSLKERVGRKWLLKSDRLSFIGLMEGAMVLEVGGVCEIESIFGGKVVFDLEFLGNMGDLFEEVI